MKGPEKPPSSPGGARAGAPHTGTKGPARTPPDGIPFLWMKGSGVVPL